VEAVLTGRRRRERWEHEPASEDRKHLEVPAVRVGRHALGRHQEAVGRRWAADNRVADEAGRVRLSVEQWFGVVVTLKLQLPVHRSALTSRRATRSWIACSRPTASLAPGWSMAIERPSCSLSWRSMGRRLIELVFDIDGWGRLLGILNAQIRA
jgi:hypothetical protein